MAQPRPGLLGKDDHITATISASLFFLFYQCSQPSKKKLNLSFVFTSHFSYDTLPCGTILATLS